MHPIISTCKTCGLFLLACYPRAVSSFVGSPCSTIVAKANKFGMVTNYDQVKNFSG